MLDGKARAVEGSSRRPFFPETTIIIQISLPEKWFRIYRTGMRKLYYYNG
jgi:hypothetical protein